MKEIPNFDKVPIKIKKSTKKKLIQLLGIIILCIVLKVMDYFFVSQREGLYEIVKFIVSICVVGLILNLLRKTGVKQEGEEED